MKRALHWLAVAIAVAVIFDVIAEAVADARPGGGGTFSGGGGHSRSGGGSHSSNSGGGGRAIGELIYWIIRLLFEVPQIGVPILLLIIGYFVYHAYRQRQNADWDSGPPVELEAATSVDDLRRVDPDFSLIVFEDFAFRLFSTAHRARHSPDALAAVAPYVSNTARVALAQRTNQADDHLPSPAHPVRSAQVLSVVVGALRTVRVVIGERQQLDVEYEANVTTAAMTSYSVERWRFVRARGARSKPPRSSRSFPCPNCGAPWQAAAAGTQICASCSEPVDNGRFDWMVESITVRSSDVRPPTVTNEVPERGTDLPTYQAPDVARRLGDLAQRDPAASVGALEQRLAVIYRELHRSWAANDLAPVRGLLSDGLYDYLQYWIDAYRQSGVRNQLIDMRIVRTEFAKVTRDRWYDAVTIRLWGTGKDFVVDGNGRVVRGSPHRERPYSEYWTLIRSAERRAPTVLAPQCPNCGAALAITQSGECEFCNAHVTAGEFDWVLSKIEQDDTYRG